MLRFDANLYRIATTCQSTEETRFYLKGVHVTPRAAGGVILVATDGHRLLAIHDANGAADESAIVALTPESLKACKPARDEERVVTIPTGSSNATVNVVLRSNAESAPQDQPRTMNDNCRIDGTFPDWRRVVPTVELPAKSLGSFNGQYLGAFGKIAAELEKHFDVTKNATMRLAGSDASSPHLVLFGNVPQAFGVLMPVRSDESAATPEWFNATAPIATAAE